MEAGAAVLNESVIYLPQVGSTNAWAKENIAQFGPVGAVYTTDQTAGRGRLGRGWVDAPGKGLYYTAVIKTDLAQPSTLPLFASLAVCDALKQRYGIDCQIKWPNDLLLNGKKIVGILCEVAPDGHSLVVGIGINLAQPQEYFDMAGLPHGTSLLLQGVNVDLDTDPEWLAQYMTDFGFDRRSGPSGPRLGRRARQRAVLHRRNQNGSGTAVHAAVVRVLGCLRRIKAALWH